MGTLIMIIDKILENIPVKNIARYRLIEKLGEGGFGVVYKVESKGLLYAIKILNSDLSHNKDIIGRFIREANLQRQLKHPNIISTVETGKHMGRHYIVSEFAEGRDLRARIRKGGHLNQYDTLIIMGHIASALEYLHSHSIVHQDLKPANVLFHKDIVKLCDFGISTISGSYLKSRIELTIRMGSAPYMSPEQIKGGSIDHRSDIYAFGVTSYETATGQSPFLAQDIHTTKMKHLNYTPADPYRINPGVSKKLSDCIMKMIEKEQDKRYQSIEEILKSLSDIAGRQLRTEFENTSSNTGTIKFKSIKPTIQYGDGFLQDTSSNGFSFTTINVLQPTNRIEVEIKNKNYPSGLKAIAEVLIVEKISEAQYKVKCRFINMDYYEKGTVEKNLPGL
ncbi:hypothetical protein B9J78_05705 [bacterium Unc6]|nr:hypothetical protein [bacterium Unc6]